MLPALFPLPLAFSAGYTGYPREVYLYILLMAIFPQLVGHTSFNWAVRWVSPTFVTLAILFLADRLQYPGLLCVSGSAGTCSACRCGGAACRCGHFGGGAAPNLMQLNCYFRKPPRRQERQGGRFGAINIL
ncbi:MAG: hypothetical protein KME26_14255 [Oscillatoria princeps RMCB-10]|nr:hypothetical protein [Oscillatoria princeps RMCB-10]